MKLRACAIAVAGAILILAGVLVEPAAQSTEMKLQAVQWLKPDAQKRLLEGQ
jgi:hypothetical protein